MLLFLDDHFDEHGVRRVYTHRETKNQSFLHMAVVLKQIGCKNNAFHLALYDTDLIHIDPHDPHLSQTLKLKIAQECRRNLWYYLREVIRIPLSGGDGMPFKLHRGNLSMAWCFLAGIDYTGTQPRQTGKAQPLYARIKIPGGWTQMGDLSVGDRVMAPDGTTTTVVGIYPQGTKAIYRVTFEDGRSTECCDEHLWQVAWQSAHGVSEWRVQSLHEIRAQLAAQPGRLQAVIPLAKPDPADAPALSRRLQDAFAASGGDATTSTMVWRAAGAASAAHVQSLVWSLGGVCQRDAAHQLTIRMDASHLAIASIEYVGAEPCQCIEVDHPDHLYITDDFIVTHNTIGAIALTSWVLYIAGINMTMAMYTHSAQLVQENVARLKAIRDLLPKWLVHRTMADTDNKEGLSYAQLGNKYLTFIGQKDKHAAHNIGRGQTLPFVHTDEGGFIPNIKISFPVLLAAQGAARRNAKAMGMPHSNIYTTTAASTDTESGRYLYELVTKAMPFTEKLYDCKNLAEAMAMVERNSTNRVVNGTFSHLQLGFDNVWLLEETSRINATPEMIKRDFLNQWVGGAENGIISKEDLERMNATRSEPHHVEIFNGYTISWYVPRAVSESPSFRAKPFVMGCDPSEMINRDFTTFVALDPQTLEVVFTFRCNESNTTKVGMLAAELLIAFPKMLWVPERKSTGPAIIDTAIMILQRHGINPFLRIYNKVVDGYGTDEFRGVNLHDPAICDGAHRKHLGFMTTGKTREHLYKQTLQKAVALNADRMFDANLIAEFATLSAVNGRIDHGEGKHDDMVIAYLLACYAIFDGKNLHLYGIPTDSIMSGITISGERVDPRYLAQQAELRRQIKQLEAQANQATNTVLQQAFRHKVAQLKQYVNDNVALEPIAKDDVRRDHESYGRVYAGPQGLAPARSLTPQQLIEYARVA